MRITTALFVGVVIVALLGVSVDAQCTSSLSCSSCVAAKNSNNFGCHYCGSGSGYCYDWYAAPNSCPIGKDTTFASECPGGGGGGKGDNGSIGGNQNNPSVLGAFIPLYIIQLVVVIILHVWRSKSIAPIVSQHSVRNGVSDFSALPDGTKVAGIIQTECSQDLVWSDVSLRVPRIPEMIPTFLFLLIGIIWVSVAHWNFFVPVFLFFLIPGFIYIFVGLSQVLGKKHWSNIYWLTSHGAVIRTGGACGAKSDFYPYSKMKDINTTTSAMGTGSVYFATKTMLEKNHHHHNGRLHAGERVDHVDHHGNTYTKKKVAIGFENIVRYGDVQGIIQNKIAAANSPTVVVNMPNVVYAQPGFPQQGYAPPQAQPYQQQQQQQPYVPQPQQPYVPQPQQQQYVPPPQQPYQQ